MNTTLSNYDFSTFVYDPAQGDFIAQENDGTSSDIRVASYADMQMTYAQAPTPVYQLPMA
jgi:hypothetical protein